MSVHKIVKSTFRSRLTPARSGLHRGFTIVELLIVIVVIAILATITIVVFRGIQDRAETAVLESDLTQAAKQLAMDNAVDGTFPDSSTDPNTHLSSSTGVTYEYDADGSGFCLSAIKGEKAYHITSTGSPQPGVCPGHTGPIVGGGGSPSCVAGYILVPGSSHYGTSDFCVAKYEAKNVGGVATSQAAGTPWVSISQTNAIARASEACSSCRLITEAEWMTIATNAIGVASNWGSGNVGSGVMYRGHTDNNPANSLAASSNDSNGYEGTGNSSGEQRRTLTLSNGEVIWDLAGNVWEWTNATIAGGQQPGLSGESSNTWKDYNNGSLQWNGLSSTSRPTGTLYPRSQGVGGLYSNVGEASVRAFLRGGDWSGGSYAGVLMLRLNHSPGSTGTSIGFRVSRDTN